MLAISILGEMERLGNQLFQYYFLRSTAVKLGVKYWCPAWIGRDIICLRDEKILVTVHSVVRFAE